MTNQSQDPKVETKKGFWAKLVEKIDEKLKNRAKSSCCCGGSKDKEDSKCC